MRITLLLCDHAQVSEGKLFIAGAGWNVTNAETPPSAIAVLVSVPWNNANQRIPFQLRLLDEDGNVVMQEGPLGDAPLQVTGEFEVGRPVGVDPGTELEAPLAFPIPPLRLLPGHRYCWRLQVSGEERDEWRLPFSTRRTS